MMETKTLEVGFYHSKAMVDGKEIYKWAISSANVDRTAECLDINGGIFDDFLNTHSGVYYNHSLGTTKPIGKGIRVYPEGDLLMSEMWFTEIEGTDSSIVKSLVDMEVIKTASVGFEPISWIDLPMTVEQRERFKGRPWITNIRKYTKWRLLEWSIVNMPANLDAQLQNAKKLLEITNSIDNKISGENMETKAGRVLSAATMQKIRVIAEQLQALITQDEADDAKAEDEKCDPNKKPMKSDDVIEMADFEESLKQVITTQAEMNTKIDMLIALGTAEEEKPEEPKIINPMKTDDLRAEIRKTIKQLSN